MADCAALEMLCPGNRTGGSNPPLSASGVAVMQRLIFRADRGYTDGDRWCFEINTSEIIYPKFGTERHVMTGRILEGKVALVTGSGRGLGRSFAEHLASLGCSLGIHGMREDGPAEFGEGTTLTETANQIAKQYGIKACRVLGDLTNPDDVNRVVDTVCAELGPLDILVHNAGGDIAAAGGKPNPNDAVHIKLEDVKAVLDRNLLSTILTCQAAAKIMMPRKSGRILTLSSISAFKGLASSSIYATAKAAVVEYTRCLAEQLRTHNINVNSLAPGDTRTGRFLGTRTVADERLVTEGTLDRIGMVDEVTRVVEFFAGPLGDFVTGQVLRVDGGSQIWSA